VLVASTPDLLRLLSVPLLAIAAWRDVRTRRVPNAFWYPLIGLGIALLAWEWFTFGPGFQRDRLVQATLLSVGIVVPLSYLFWRFGAFGGADAKALMALAVLFPTYPVFYFPTEAFPLVVSTVGVFSLTILTNAVFVGLAYPLVLGARNLLAGNLDHRMLVARPVSWEAVPGIHGGLRSAPPDGPKGLDLDALRMYLRWRRTDLATLRENPELRDPATLPEDPGDPTDGAVRTDLTGLLGTRTEGEARGADPIRAGTTSTEPATEGRTATDESDDPWGAAAFLEAIHTDAYGTSAAQLRAGLDVLVERDHVWISPGLPFLVPVFLGLLVALTLGDVMIGAVLFLGGL
jgi:preflagellin peptidase FlaK